MGKFNLGLVSITFRDKTPEEILSAMKDTGLSFIEWGSDVHAPKDDIERLEGIAALQKKYNVICSSYGTYFRLGVTPINELEGYINAAKILGTNILRLWCGDKNSQDYSIGEKEALFFTCKKAKDIAEKHNVILCMECHNSTYTNKKDSAVELMNAVNSEAFKMYWQPNQLCSFEENLAYAKAISACSKHIHVFNWNGEEKFPLISGIDMWQKYLECFNNDKVLLLEFMPDNRIESLKSESDALRKIVGVK